MKVIVAGSRGFTDKSKVFRILDTLHRLEPSIEIVSGLAAGPDSFGKEWAISRKVECHKFPAMWDQYGKRAGYIRNEQMADFSDILLAFWDNKSRGTMHMINIAKDRGLKVKVFT